MAGLLFPSVRPLTCRTAAILKAMKMSPVITKHEFSSISSAIPSKTIYSMRPSCRQQLSFKPGTSVRRWCRCFTSQQSEGGDNNADDVSKLNSLQSEEKPGVLENSSNCASNTSVEQDHYQRTQNKNGTEMHSSHGSSLNAEQENHTGDAYNLSQSVFSTSSRDDSHVNEQGSHTVDAYNFSQSSNSASSRGDSHINERTEVTVASVAEGDVDGASPLPALSREEDGENRELPLKRAMEPSFSLVPYVGRSLVLQRLVSMGVDLAAVEKVKGAADCLVQADWDRDVQPRLLFLRDLGVEDDHLGTVLTKNPLLLKAEVQDMQECIGYLESKKFSGEQVSRIVTSAPLVLLLPVTYIDKKLGFLQKTFHLKGDEVRHVVTKLPKIVPWKLQKLKDVRFYMKEMLGFSDREMKSMLLTTPRVFLSDRHQLGKRFDLLHNVMGLTHRDLTAWPGVLRTRLHILDQRHRFLVLLGRAQYRPDKENYVSLQALASGRDEDFCSNVAKAPTSQFYSFLKSL